MKATLKERENLLEIAEVCAWVPENPARTFHEAVQSVWFAHMLLLAGEQWSFRGPGQDGSVLVSLL